MIGLSDIAQCGGHSRTARRPVPMSLLLKIFYNAHPGLSLLESPRIDGPRIVTI